MFGVGKIGLLGLTRYKGGGVAYDPAAVALFARFTTPPTTARKALINACIVALKAAGLWTKFDAFYMLAAETAQAARQNWVQDAFNLSAINAPTFTADRGYTGDGSSSYLNTNLSPSTATQFTKNSAHISVADRTSRAGITKFQIGAQNGSGIGGYIVTRDASNLAHFPLNDGDAVAGQFANTTSAGRFVGSRTGSALRAGYMNGASLGTSTELAASGTSAFNFYIGGLDNSGSLLASADQLSQASFGAGLSSGDVTAFDAAIAAYLTAVGA